MDDKIFIGLDLDQLNDLVKYLDLSDNENLTAIKEKIMETIS